MLRREVLPARHRSAPVNIPALEDMAKAAIVTVIGGMALLVAYGMAVGP